MKIKICLEIDIDSSILGESEFLKTIRDCEEPVYVSRDCDCRVFSFLFNFSDTIETCLLYDAYVYSLYTCVSIDKITKYITGSISSNISLSPETFYMYVKIHRLNCKIFDMDDFLSRVLNIESILTSLFDSVDDTSYLENYIDIFKRHVIDKTILYRPIVVEKFNINIQKLDPLFNGIDWRDTRLHYKTIYTMMTREVVDDIHLLTQNYKTVKLILDNFNSMFGDLCEEYFYNYIDSRYYIYGDNTSIRIVLDIVYIDQLYSTERDESIEIREYKKISFNGSTRSIKAPRSITDSIYSKDFRNYSMDVYDSCFFHSIGFNVKIDNNNREVHYLLKFQEDTHDVHTMRSIYKNHGCIFYSSKNTIHTFNSIQSIKNITSRELITIQRHDEYITVKNRSLNENMKINLYDVKISGFSSVTKSFILESVNHLNIFTSIYGSIKMELLTYIEKNNLHCMSGLLKLVYSGNGIKLKYNKLNIQDVDSIDFKDYIVSLFITFNTIDSERSYKYIPMTVCVDILKK